MSRLVENQADSGYFGREAGVTYDEFKWPGFGASCASQTAETLIKLYGL